MKETLEKMTDEITVTENEAVETKLYKFRKLSAEDMFLMFRILGKIGFKELKGIFEGDALASALASFRSEGVDKDKALVSVGVSVGFEAIDIILNNLPKCEKDIYQLLAQTSNMTEKAIKGDAILFTEMLVDFVKKEEFPAFFKAVSKLFK